MRYRPAFLAILLVGTLLFTACQPRPEPVESVGTEAQAEGEPDKIFQKEYQIRETPESPTDLKPGLYCLSAVDGEGSFQLVAPDQTGDKLIREQRFSSRAWVEVRAGELLRFSGSVIETYDEREQQEYCPTRLGNGFFLIGVDLFPGILTVEAMESEGSGDPVCEIYTTAHDLLEGPVRIYEFDYPIINIRLEEGEFLLLQNADIFIPST
ncbi:MAG: hypothetical protein GX819_03090 [Clostridiaceae bacterium]|nr:hypothetical protein [Clostridiaceae bacterium]